MGKQHAPKQSSWRQQRDQTKARTRTRTRTSLSYLGQSSPSSGVISVSLCTTTLVTDMSGCCSLASFMAWARACMWKCSARRKPKGGERQQGRRGGSGRMSDFQLTCQQGRNLLLIILFKQFFTPHTTLIVWLKGWGPKHQYFTIFTTNATSTFWNHIQERGGEMLKEQRSCMRPDRDRCLHLPRWRSFSRFSFLKFLLSPSDVRGHKITIHTGKHGKKA